MDTQLNNPDPLKQIGRIVGLKITGVWFTHRGELRLHFDDGTYLCVDVPSGVTQGAADERV